MAAPGDAYVDFDIADPDELGFMPWPSKPPNADWFEKYRAATQVRYLLTRQDEKEQIRGMLWILKTYRDKPTVRVTKMDKQPLECQPMTKVPFCHYPTVRYLVWVIGYLQSVLESYEFSFKAVPKKAPNKSQMEAIKATQYRWDKMWSKWIYLRRVCLIIYDSPILQSLFLFKVLVYVMLLWKNNPTAARATRSINVLTAWKLLEFSSDGSEHNDEDKREQARKQLQGSPPQLPSDGGKHLTLRKVTLLM
jgi:hypothetical protein